MKLHRTIFSVILTIVSFLGLYAQEATVSTGGEATGSSGSVSYSVGQVVYSSIEQSTGSISQGVQQAYEIFATSAKELTNIDLYVEAYPNPTTDVLILSIQNSDYTKAVFVLTDLSGKQILRQEITGEMTTIDMSNLIQSEYFVSVLFDKKEIKTFKIIKN